MTSSRPLAVLLSGSGRTLENLLDRIAAGSLAATIVTVVSSRPDVRGVDIARRAGIPVAVVPREGRSTAAWSEAIFAPCRSASADLVVMAGFLHLLAIPADFAGRVINIHPSLLPAFGGKGFHGEHVHRAVAHPVDGSPLGGGARGGAARCPGVARGSLLDRRLQAGKHAGRALEAVVGEGGPDSARSARAAARSAAFTAGAVPIHSASASADGSSWSFA